MSSSAIAEEVICQTRAYRAQFDTIQVGIIELKREFYDGLWPSVRFGQPWSAVAMTLRETFLKASKYEWRAMEMSYSEVSTVRKNRKDIPKLTLC